MTWLKFINVKVLIVVTAIVLTIASLYGAYFLGTRSCTGIVAEDTLEELQEDQTIANELSDEASERIRYLEQTITRLRGERSESNIDDCMLPDDTKRLRKDALSLAFPSSD